MNKPPTYEELLDKVKALQQSLDSYRTLVHNTQDLIYRTDLEGRISYVSPSVYRLSGYTVEEAIGMHMAKEVYLYPEERNDFLAILREKGQITNFEARLKRKDGTIWWSSTNAHFYKDLDGNILGVEGITRDITEHKQAETALRLNEERLEVLVALNNMTAAGERELTHFAMEAAVRLTNSTIGYVAFVSEDESVLTMQAWSEQAMRQCAIVDKPIVYSVAETGLWGEAVRQRKPIITNDYAAPNRWKRGYPEGHVALVRHLNVPIMDGDRVVIVAGVGNKKTDYDQTDVRQLMLLMSGMWRILERKQADLALRESENRFRSIMEQSTFSMMILSPDGNVLDVNQACLELWAVSREIACTYNILADAQMERLGLMPHVRRAMTGEKVSIPAIDYDLSATLGEGTRKIVAGDFYPLRDANGTVRHIILIQQDITERKRATEALRESEKKYRNVLDQSLFGIFQTTSDGRALFINQQMARMLGAKSPAEAMENYPDLARDLYADAGQREALISQLKKRGIVENFEFEAKGLNGKRVWLRANYKSREIIPNGTFVIEGFCLDITERKRATTERDELQAQLLHAQKMESVGQLAGGVAHDFNNMLSAIMGYAELGLMRCTPSHPLYTNLKGIQAAGERAADITRQLLAFARKQPVAPKVIDLNDTISGTLKMLQRLIGEDVGIAWIPRGGLHPVKIDPTQIDQILANLCVNARDAIAGLGKITIETQNVHFDEAYCAAHRGFKEGGYVMIGVSDDGCGMGKEVIDHIFEPFFTTKEIGKGTGLGLAMVYGIVKQNDGFINVYSEPDQGTTFRIYLPALQKAALEPIEASFAPLAKGHETVLVVDDEPTVLKITQTMLDQLGYDVFTAATPGEAIRLAEEQAVKIHLLITDVVMPEMNCRDLADKLLVIYPELKCLFMSGYTANVITHHSVLDEGVNFIQKPFSIMALGDKVREALDKDKA